MGLRMIRIILVVSIFMPFAVRATTCNDGEYLTDGKCTKCDTGYYCPTGNTMIKCPTNTQDWQQIYTDQGYEVSFVSNVVYYSWSHDGSPVSQNTNCHLGLSAYTSIGVFYSEPVFNGIDYDINYDKLWFQAAVGYYLAKYYFTSANTWYRGVKACTNAPAHAHYTGPGTPDEPKSGGATDYNDCPWECNDGYGLHGDGCAPLCKAGMRYIKTGGGLVFNLYSARHSSPTLAVRNNGTVCYGILVPGAGANTININRAGTIYHIEN